MNLDNEFGQLRATMQDNASIQGEALMTWLSRVESHDPERYHTQWVPYLESFTHHWRKPLITVDTIEKLEDAARIAPFALFAFDGSAWTGLKRYAMSQGKLPPSSWPPGFLTAHGFNDEKMAAFIESDALVHLSHLNLAWGKLSPVGVTMLAECEALKNLEKLELRYHYDIKNEGLEALIASPHITKLEYLDVSQTHADASAFIALAQSPFARNLRELHFWNRVDQEPIAQAFHASTSLTQLEHLKLSETSSQDICDVLSGPNAASLRCFEFDSTDAMTLDQIQAISSSPYITRLDTLKLPDLELHDEHMRILGKSRTLGAIHTLDLSDNELTSEGIRHLVEAPWSASIKSLKFEDNPLDNKAFEELLNAKFALTHLTLQEDVDQPWIDLDEGFALWLSSPKSASLTHLELEHPRLSKSFAALAKAHHIQNLTTLRIRGEGFDPAVLIALCHSPVCTRLTKLDLSNTWGEDRVEHTVALCQSIKDSAYMRSLTHLDLSGLDLSDEALILLAQAPACSSLTFLNIKHEDFSEHAIRALATSPYFKNLTKLDIDLDYIEPGAPIPTRTKILMDSPHLPREVREHLDPTRHLDDGW